MNVLDIIFPIECLGCKKRGKYICSDCLFKVKNAKLLCVECHKPSIDGATHVKCRRVLSPDFAFSPWDYDGVIREAILRLKYNFAYKIAENLAEEFVFKIKRDIPILPKKAVLIPIPLYKTRKNWRGFNQSEEMGEIIAKKIGWNYTKDLLYRRKKTKPQTELKGKERETNIRNAFSLDKSLMPSDENYIIFDDVMTTGSTLKEACKVLKRKGVRKVWGLTIAV